VQERHMRTEPPAEPPKSLPASRRDHARARSMVAFDVSVIGAWLDIRHGCELAPYSVPRVAPSWSLRPSLISDPLHYPHTRSGLDRDYGEYRICETDVHSIDTEMLM